MEDFGRYVTDQVLRTDRNFTLTITSEKSPYKDRDGSTPKMVCISIKDGRGDGQSQLIRTHLPNGYQLGSADWLVNVKTMIEQMDEWRQKYKDSDVRAASATSCVTQSTRLATNLRATFNQQRWPS